MKFLKILVSLNLVVTMPFVAPAFAADQTVSDKAAWLQNSLGENKKSSDLVELKATQGSLSQSYTNVRLRPFVPNRKLPSQKELDQAALVALTPRMAPDPNVALSGRITTNTINNTTVSTLHKDVPNVHKFINTITALSKTAAAAKANFAAASAPSVSSANVAVQEEQSAISSQVPAQVGYPMMRQAERHLFAQSQTTQEALADQALIERFAANELGSDATVGGSGLGATTNSAGPPPFPLNLLPEASLKQLIHGLGRQQNLVSRTTAAASFGSWPHRQMIASRLPLAGFQSHIHSYGYAHACAHRHYARTTYQQSQHMQTITRIRRNLYWTARQPWIPMSREVRNALNVAAYPPYAGQIRLF